MNFLFGNSENNTILGGPLSEFIWARKGDDYVHSGAGNDFVWGGKGNDILDGGAGSDSLLAGRGDDTLVFKAADGENGALFGDYYDGGKGADTLRIEFTIEEWNVEAIRQDIIAFATLLENSDPPKFYYFASVNLSVSSIEMLELVVDGEIVDPLYTGPEIIDLGSSTENETVEVSGDDDTIIYTGSGDDTIITGNGNNVVTTGAGNDTVITGSGYDQISTGDGDDYIESGDGNDLVSIGNGHDVVRTGAGDDTVVAGAGGGDDIIDMGAGNFDRVEYPSASGIVVDLNALDRSATLLNAHPTYSTVGEYLFAEGYAPNLAVGLATGPDIDTDILIGIEIVEGSVGDDIFYGNEEINRLLGKGGNDEIYGGDNNDRLEGGIGNDILFGEAGNDILEGGQGNDTIDGGDGQDQLVLQGSSTDYVFETNINDGTITITDIGGNGDGIDSIIRIEEIVFSDNTLGLWALVDSIQHFGTNGPDIIYGTPGRDRFYGRDGNDTLLGFEAEDEFVGGRGDDIFDGGSGTQDDANFVWDIANYIDDGGTLGVTVNLTTGFATDTYGDTDTLIDIERVFGTNLADTLIGSDEWAEAYDPHGGDDTIIGGGGWDNLRYNLSDGNGGTQGIIVQFDAVIEGSGTVLSDPFGNVDTFSGIEAIHGTKYDDVFMGGAGAQSFRGLDGADIYDGGAGIDEVRFSNDASYGGILGVNVDLLLDLNGDGFADVTDGWGNIDQIINVENIVGTGASDTILGDNNANRLDARAGDDYLEGRGGQDELIGGLGNDTLDGGDDNDYLLGGDDNDILIGGSGDDYMEGGFGNDEFRFAAGSGQDTIGDFDAEYDVLSIGGLTISSTLESDVDGDGFLDTTVFLSSGDTIDLLFVSGVTDWNDLLL